MLLVVLAVIWFPLGILFGIPRARARYWQVIEAHPLHLQDSPKRMKTQAFTDASIELIKWTLLGLFTVISYFSWIALDLALQAQKNQQNPSPIEAFIVSAAIFVLGIIALDDRGKL